MKDVNRIIRRLQRRICGFDLVVVVQGVLILRHTPVWIDPVENTVSVDSGPAQQSSDCAKRSLTVLLAADWQVVVEPHRSFRRCSSLVHRVSVLIDHLVQAWQLRVTVPLGCLRVPFTVTSLQLRGSVGP